MYKSIVALDPNLVASTLHQGIQQLPRLNDPTGAMSTLQIEAMLWMLWKVLSPFVFPFSLIQTGEGFDERALTQSAQFWLDTVDTLNSMNISQHPHPV